MISGNTTIIITSSWRTVHLVTGQERTTSDRTTNTTTTTSNSSVLWRSLPLPRLGRQALAVLANSLTLEALPRADWSRPLPQHHRQHRQQFLCSLQSQRQAAAAARSSSSSSPATSSCGAPRTINSWPLFSLIFVSKAAAVHSSVKQSTGLGRDLIERKNILHERRDHSLAVEATK